MTRALSALEKRLRAGKRDRQARALRLIQLGRSDAEIVRELGVRRETLWRWKQDPRFAAARAAYRQGCHEEAARVLSGAEPLAAEHLARVIVDASAGEPVRVRAAEAVLGMARETASEDGGAVEDVTLAEDARTLWFQGRRYELAEERPLARRKATTCEVEP